MSSDTRPPVHYRRESGDVFVIVGQRDHVEVRGFIEDLDTCDLLF